MSRAVDAEPMIAPEGPKIGEIADSTTMCLPSLRMQTVSSGSTRSPRLRRSSMSLRRSPSARQQELDGAADHLLGAVAEDALGRAFQLVTLPSGERATIESNDEPTMASLASSAVSRSFCSVMSRM